MKVKDGHTFTWRSLPNPDGPYKKWTQSLQSQEPGEGRWTHFIPWNRKYDEYEQQVYISLSEGLGFFLVLFFISPSALKHFSKCCVLSKEDKRAVK